MSKINILLILAVCVRNSWSVLCFNCSGTHRSIQGCAGLFATKPEKFNSSRKYLVNCSGEDALCFVRSWSSRTSYSWIVQRGCYEPQKEDPILETLTIPTRSMTCARKRLVDSEYTLCMCQADWCNSTQQKTLSLLLVLTFICFVLAFVIT